MDKGMSKERLLQIRQHKCNPMTMKVTYYQRPVFIHHGYMQWLWDMDGRRYLDMFAGVATVVYLTNSGSEANDLALLMARLHTGNYAITTLRGAYHGGSGMTIDLTSNAAYKFPVTSGQGCHSTMCPDVFRGPWGGSHCRDSPVQTTRECNCSPGQCLANNKYIDQLKEEFTTCVPHQIAGLFAEPIQGVGGVVQYPRNFLRDAYKLVREKGGICIADEVQTGFARTGSHYWGFQGHDVIPDMVTMAKGIANGFPMGAVVTTEEIARSFGKGLHFNTFGGGPLSCAVASSVLDVIKEDGLQETCEEVGTYLLEQLAKLRDKHEIVGDVRGKGLMIGVEMVKDKRTDRLGSRRRRPASDVPVRLQVSRDPLPPEHMDEIFEDTKDMGVLIGKGGNYAQIVAVASLELAEQSDRRTGAQTTVMKENTLQEKKDELDYPRHLNCTIMTCRTRENTHGQVDFIISQVFRLKPPLCVTKADADFFLAVFDQALQNYTERR
ncbi:hypothetical protein P4O66_002941 [Electrophorus voltai]|uniref:Alanine--glyoxylate aminotransferase 2, mitochondrial n=1 Tax=Electrophorus voltai TaxID=2609070 RepID=A0AAD8YX09_9TELE|nr:hypothetical protein P4O66_002941 [Electrophorus voltai]